jgi:hypothetical protein
MADDPSPALVSLHACNNESSLPTAVPGQLPVVFSIFNTQSQVGLLSAGGEITQPGLSSVIFPSTGPLQLLLVNTVFVIGLIQVKLQGDTPWEGQTWHGSFIASIRIVGLEFPGSSLSPGR